MNVELFILSKILLKMCKHNFRRIITPFNFQSFIDSKKGSLLNSTDNSDLFMVQVFSKVDFKKTRSILVL